MPIPEALRRKKTKSSTGVHEQPDKPTLPRLWRPRKHQGLEDDQPHQGDGGDPADAPVPPGAFWMPPFLIPH